jgi:hypothetical protein
VCEGNTDAVPYEVFEPLMYKVRGKEREGGRGKGLPVPMLTDLHCKFFKLF